MDRIKRLREAERAVLSCTIATMHEELKKTPPNPMELGASLQRVDTLVEKLKNFDDQFKDSLLTDGTTTDSEFLAECTKAEEYVHKANLVKLMANQVLYPITPANSQPPSVSVQSKRNFRLPKIELKKFSGELVDWLGWWAQFKKIDEDEEIHNSDKFTYLVQSMKEGSRASEVVNLFPASSENYPKAIEALKERFGKRKLLKQVYVRELIKMILDNKTKEKTPLSTLYDRLESSLRSLESLGVSTEQMVEFLYPMVESSLPDETLLAWQRSPFYGQDGSTSIPPKSELHFLFQFLKTEVENEEQRKLAQAGFNIEISDRKRSHKKKELLLEEDLPTAAVLFSGDGKARNKTCIFCDKHHESRDCLRAQAMPIEERKSKVQSRGACFICLQSGHVSRKCKSAIRCLNCGKKHLILLCPEFASKKPDGATDVAQNFQVNLNCTDEVLLQTLMATIRNPDSKKSKLVRVLIDCGSQHSYILSRTAKDLGLQPVSRLKVNHILFGGVEVASQDHLIYNLSVGNTRGQYTLPITLMSQPRICGQLPRMSQGPWLQELQRKGIYVTDSDPRHSLEIEIMIGADFLSNILTGSMVMLGDGLSATETKLGWTLMGRHKKNDSYGLAAISMNLSFSTVTDLWNLESIGIRDPIETSREESRKEAHDHFVRTVLRNADGRYSVSLPWRGGKASLPNNRAVAFTRLESTTKRLVSSQKYSIYDSTFKEWEAEGIISTVDETFNPGLHFLPHRAVFKDSLTTPVRQVFDASSHVGNSPSLNDCLEKGPNYLELIPSLILRFRMGAIGVIADIRKAFLMIDVNEEDRDYLQFLWWSDLSQRKVKVYRHNRVVFGMNCSPFLLTAVIAHHLLNTSSIHPEVLAKVRDSLYVDNLVLAVSTDFDYDRLKTIATEVLCNAKMELRQWKRTGFPGQSPVTGVLGLKWDKLSDEIYCNQITSVIPFKITKRVILSQIQRIFDPIGLLSPALIVPKVLLQMAWVDCKQWDTEVSLEVAGLFRKWWEELATVIERIRLPRDCIEGLPKSIGNFQIHVFCDASKKAYAAVVFLRVETLSGVKVHLLESKARVAPLKPASIPRLELLACCIASRLKQTVQKAISMEGFPVFMWSDSTTALAWIQRLTEWGTFVSNRVEEIRRLTKQSEWHHVPGDQNPADLPSRGVTPKQFAESRWWEGPGWLRMDSSM